MTALESAPLTPRTLRLTVDAAIGNARDGSGLSAATDADVHSVVLVLDASSGALTESAAHALCLQLRALTKPVVAEVSGWQGDTGISLCASVDLAVAARTTVFESDGVSSGALEELWLRYLPVRAAKWVALGAGAVDAAEALRLGFVNMVVDDAELGAAVERLTSRIGFVPADILAVKKRANDFRLRWA